MKTFVIEKFGSGDVFIQKEVNRPEAAPGQVLIRVVATSVNPLDTKIRSGALTAFAPPFPAVLHGDVAGYVEEVGPGVFGYAKGDEVYGCVGGVTNNPGVLADYVAVDARLIARKPHSLSMAEAAALPLVAITAWEALIDRARIQPGQKILVHAATGGVGHIAIQLAKSRDAQVYTTVSSSAKAAIAKTLGADDTIDYKNESVAHFVQRCTAGEGFDVVFDTVGGENLTQSLKAVALNGKVVSILTFANPDLGVLLEKNASLDAVLMLIPLLTGKGRERHGQILSEISKLVDQGKIKPLLDPHSFNFSDVAKAHALAESGKAIGKVVLMNQ